MKNLCITGSVQASIERFSALLQQAGATPAQPAARNPEMTMAAWHSKVLAIYATRDADLACPPLLGRAWEQMAGDIFLANHDQPCWFWAERNSNQLLDFWEEFDPQTLFLLLYDSPESALSAAMESGVPDLNELQVCLEQWYRENQQMMQFHLRYPARSIMIDSRSTISLRNCLEGLCKHWALQLKATDDLSIPSPQTSSPLALYLIEQLLQENNQIQALHNEIQPFLKGLTSLSTDKKSSNFEQAILTYLEEQRRYQAVHKQSQLLFENLDSQQQNLEKMNKRLDACQQQLNDYEEENQLLLEQLHQTQEELDKQILKAQSQKLNEYETWKISLEQENNELRIRCDEKSRIASEQLAQIERLQTQLSDIESENDLILLQLHETQEELEQYLLKLQDSEKKQAILQQRLNNMQERFPDYWACDGLEVVHAEDGSSQWLFRNADIGGRLLPELHFTLQPYDGLAGLLLHRNSENSPLLRWPASLASSNTLLCLPCDGSITEGNNALLTGLGSSDWQFLKDLLRHLTALLENTREQHLPETLDQVTLRQQLLALQDTLASWPDVLRYDSIELIGNQQLPEYDSLEIRLSNLQLGHQYWPLLQYRLASVDPKFDYFGQYPRLEFPEISRDSLQNWYAETEDERGARLELRFALPDAMDIQVWQRLAPQDQLLIASLLVNFPWQLDELQNSEITINREWREWQALTNNMLITLSRTINIK